MTPTSERTDAPDGRVAPAAADRVAPASDAAALAAAVQAITRAYRVLERASSDLSLAEFRMLSAIAAGEARASRLAARLAVGKPTVSAGIESLVRRGFVERADVVGDQRASALSLTDVGVAARERAEVEMAARLRELCERAPDPACVVDALGQLGDAIEATMEHVMAKRRNSSTPAVRRPTP
ncbi:MAG: MarR family winged helix-turn-helix transcriptional regulator [Microbacteriaceae bacterium]